jgi:outer membrane lipoprotein
VKTLRNRLIALRGRRLLWVLPLLLGACATGPKFDTTGINRALTPKNSVAKLPRVEGKPVLWGGTVLRTTNLKDGTDVEVLGYPLDSDQKPQTDQQPLGRFIFQVKGYLEPATYAKDRLVTVVGRLSRSQTGKVGESDYTYPVIAAEQLYLWPKESEYDNSGVRFGIGVGVGF